MAKQASTAAARGDMATAGQKSRQAKCWSIAAFVVGAIGVVGLILQIVYFDEISKLYGKVF